MQPSFIFEPKIALIHLIFIIKKRIIIDMLKSEKILKSTTENENCGARTNLNSTIGLGLTTSLHDVKLLGSLTS